MGPRKAEKKNRAAKEDNWNTLQTYAAEFKKAVFVDVDNVSSLQLTKIRIALRTLNAKMLMGKNTLMKASLNRFLVAPVEGDFDFEARKDSFKQRPEIEKFLTLLKGNVGIIFTNGNLSAIKDVLDNEKRGAPAKAGAFAPDEVWIRAGPTGLDPKQTSFFQTLNIQTKINKSQVEIIQDKLLIQIGDKVEASHCMLLDKLKITPFSYKMHVKHVYDNGKMIDPKVLDIKSEDILVSFQKAITTMAAVSLGSGYVTKPAVPHLLGNVFKNMVGVTYETKFTFKQAEAMKNAKAAGPAAAAGAGAVVVEEKKEEEEEMVGAGNLFGGEEDEY
jgi:large subunit ribosomal protein LP0